MQTTYRKRVLHPLFDADVAFLTPSWIFPRKLLSHLHVRCHGVIADLLGVMRNQGLATVLLFDQPRQTLCLQYSLVSMKCHLNQSKMQGGGGGGTVTHPPLAAHTPTNHSCRYVPDVPKGEEPPRGQKRMQSKH
jgi:hypothetical protein